jgi:hypothetical protein
MSGLFANFGREMRDAEIHRFQRCGDFYGKVDSGFYGLRFDGPFFNWEAVALYKPNAITGAVAYGRQIRDASSLTLVEAFTRLMAMAGRDHMFFRMADG